MTIHGFTRHALLLFLFPCVISYENCSASPIEEIRQVLREREGVIKSLGFSLEYTLEPVEAKIKQAKGKLMARFEGTKRIFIEDPDGVHDFVRQHAFDGKKSYLMGRLGSSRDSLVLQEGLASELLIKPNPLVFLSETATSGTIVGLANAEDSTAEYRDDLLILTGFLGSGKKMHVEYDFDPKNDYVLRRFVLSVDGITAKEGKLTRWQTTKIDGVHVPIPIEGTIDSFYYFNDGKMTRGLHLSLERLITLSYEVNIPYPAETFVPSVDASKRSSVWDRNLQVGYQVGGNRVLVLYVLFAFLVLCYFGSPIGLTND